MNTDKHRNRKETIKKKIIIAIDGTAGSGKSSLAKDLARKLGFIYVDTGAMYRYLTYRAIKEEIKSQKGLVDLAGRIKITHRNLLTDKIRMPEVSNMVSKVSAVKGVRKHMVMHQRAIARRGNAIVEGRDIGTVVFPDADIKLFVVADPEERARRRYKELLEKGISVNEKDVKENILSRDERDSSRKVSPLKPAKDAVVINTTKLSISQKNAIALKHIKERMR